MNDLLEELGNLRLYDLEDDWVQGIYYSEFLEFKELPSEYENALESMDMSSIFRKIMSSIEEWLNSNDENEEKSWAALSNHVEHEKILAIIAYHIDHGTKNIHTKEYRKNALLASRLYYKFLSVPGYKAYHIYHSQLFAHSLGCLSFPKAMCDNEDNYYNSRELSREVNSVIKDLGKLVEDLRSVIIGLRLTYEDMNFEDILSNLVDITGGAIVNKLSVDKIELTYISRVIYEIIDILLCEGTNEPNKETIKLLFKCILPKLIAASVDNKSANNLVRASYVTYTGLLLSKYGKSALPGYVILLQHLCYTLDGLERAEVRNARVPLIVGLMSLLPRKTYRRIVKWMLELSTTSKISHRQIALEILSNLLNNDAEDKESNAVTSEQRPVSSNEDATKTQNNVQVGEDKLQDSGVNESVTEENTEPIEEQPSTSVGDQSMQDTQPEQQPETANREEPEMAEDDVALLLRQRPHTVPHAEILRAIYERVNDISSTIRARAIAILTECVSNERLPVKEALQELNGTSSVSRVMAVCARGVVDERAAVRKGAVSLLHRSLAAAARSPTENDLGILIGLCRDASILVRTAAITAVGDLLLQLPCEASFDAFLSGPIHQLSDPENKVQEQVVNIIQLILIDRIRKYSVGTAEDLIPWQFLGAITRHNMRRHLQKACTLLLKSGNCINHRIVDMISTHIGVVNDERDLHSLVLLTSLARLLDYSDISFVLEYYYKLTEDQQERDARLMPLTLELLSIWSRFISIEASVTLREHLVRRLAASGDDGCRLACANLAAQLDSENLQWATELMQLSERRALDGGQLEEWVRAADLSLFSPVPPSGALLRLFISAINSPPSDWCEARIGASVAGLGRLCLRSREAAAEAAPTLAKLLRTPTTPAAAHNALLALADICSRYTCIVEPLLSSVCGCLSKDASPPLRRAAARALTKLLLAGFLRLRPPLYYTFCALLADSDHDVREPAEYYVTSCMTADTIYHHFVDCVIHYNKEDTDSIPFDSRQLIYDVMLQRLSLVQKLNVQCRLAREIIAHAADLCDEQSELPAELNAALLDTITLLCGPRMKLPKKPQNSGGDADIDDLQERVTTNIVSHKMKRTVAEVLVPAVLRLYSRLRSGGGQVAAYLVRIATDLLNDYRHEIEELIENDEELVQRVQQFQETIGLEPSFGNTRNLVTTSAPPEPDTPRSVRKRPSRQNREPTRKRALRV